ncbi:collagenase-like [Leptidea sinapis]|uniref:collagenase-like n=1 Tax=Leptidea sinapis TaxID=189913 RepID=UPI0021453042|nr:collagenase-like [Leptidea sinapis]
MKLLIIIVGLVVATHATERHDIITDYHNVIGIPLAQKIKQSESAMDFDGSRIIGGSVAGLGAHPYLGGLVIQLTTGWQSVCGASLLSQTRAVTAAHCWATRTSQASQLTTVWGSQTLFSGGVRIVTTNVRMHASYNMNNLNNDIAMIIINSVGLTTNIQPIRIDSGSNQHVGTWATAAGYGATSDSQQGIPNNTVKRHVNMVIMDNSVCARFYFPGIVIHSTLCTDTARGTASICGGDSGGPLVIGSSANRILTGLSSFVSSAGCQSGSPAGFARIASFADWINSNM